MADNGDAKGERLERKKRVEVVVVVVMTKGVFRLDLRERSVVGVASSGGRAKKPF